MDQQAQKREALKSSLQEQLEAAERTCLVLRRALSDLKEMEDKEKAEAEAAAFAAANKAATSPPQTLKQQTLYKAFGIPVQAQLKGVTPTTTMPTKPVAAKKSDVLTKPAEKEAPKEKTYNDLYFEKVQAIMKRDSAVTYAIVNSLNSESDDEYDEEESADEGDDEPQAKRSKPNTEEEQFAKFRIIILSKARNTAFEKAQKAVSGGQRGLNTHSCNTLIFAIPKKVAAAMKLKTNAEKFDALLGLTYYLHNYDDWFNDNELYQEGGACSKAIKGLASAWKKLLALSDAELGIDTEYSRPGVEALLQKFARTAKMGQDHYEFDWRP